MTRAIIIVPVLLTSFTLTTSAQSVQSPRAPAPPAASSALPRLPLGVGVGMDAYDTLAFLEIAAVRQELKLTPDQLAQAKKVKQEGAQTLKSTQLKYWERQKLIAQKADRAAFVAMVKERNIVLPKLQEETKRAIREVLAPHQRVRLEQLELQAIGPGAFTHPDFREFQGRLKLSPAQAKAISMLVNLCRDEMDRIATPLSEIAYQGLTPDQQRAARSAGQSRAALEALRLSATEVRERTLKEIDGILTKEQREAYRAMLGAPFDLASMRGDGRPAVSNPKS